MNVSSISNLIPYDIVLSSIVSLLSWFILRVINHYRKNKEHDKELFKQPPPQFEDCPICFLQLPTLVSGRTYYTCCGKVICSGCVYAPLYDDLGNKVNNRKCSYAELHFLNQTRKRWKG